MCLCPLGATALLNGGKSLVKVVSLFSVHRMEVSEGKQL